MLLNDQQVLFDAAGTSIYSETVVRVQKPEGLAAVGSFAAQWRPDTDTLTVHKFKILRGTATIDVLAKGQTFAVLRRENNLEYAALDGVLTATLQPEGLQVGDVLNISYTLERREPLLRGHHDLSLDAGTRNVIDVENIAVRWPSTTSISYKFANLPATPSINPRGSFDLTAMHTQPLVLPQGAPPRFQQGRLIEFSDYGTWGDVSAVFRPLFDAARKLLPSSPLTAEVARIKAMSNDPARQASAALRLVEQNIRYLYIGLNQSNLKPADADVTWTRRFGDCKAKTALLLALLDGLGIKAEPALVSVFQGDGLNERLPNVQRFDHVIVRAVINDRVYWIDGTRNGDTAIENLKTPNFHWALPLNTGSGKLEPLVVAPPSTPSVAYNLHIDASKGVTAPTIVDGEITYRDDEALAIRAALLAIPSTQLDRGLREFWKREYDFITPEAVKTQFDEPTGTLRLSMTGSAKMDWNLANQPPYYEIDGSLLGWRGDYHRDAGPNSDAPFVINFPMFTEHRETITLPPQSNAFTIEGADVDTVIAGRKFVRRTEIKNNMVTMVAQQIALAPEISFKDASDSADTLRDMAKRAVYIYAPARYEPTQEEARAALALPGTAETSFKHRVSALVTLEMYPAALNEGIKYAAAFPKSADALALRSMSHAILGHSAAAQGDAAAALSIEPKNTMALGITGFYAYVKSIDDPAVAGTYKFLAFVHWGMAEECAQRGDNDCVIREAGQALHFQPSLAEGYVLRANAFRRMDQPAQAAIQADLMTKVAPNNADMMAVAGVVYCGTGRCPDGMKAFARSIAIKPNVTAYLNRIRYLPKGDQVGRKRDIDAALKVNTASPDAIQALAQWQLDNKDFTAAIATLKTLPAKSGEDPNLKLRVAHAYVLAGMPDKARSLYGELRGFAAGSKNASLFNSLCYASATANFDLETAAEDCQSAVALAPESGPILDSAGFVQLRLGHYDEAITIYNHALKVMAKEVHSIFGRGIAYKRKGNAAASEADFAAAHKLNPEIETEFKDFGISP